MGSLRFAFDSITVQITSADCSDLLNALNAGKIRLYNVEYLDNLTVRLQIDRKDRMRAQQITQKCGGNYSSVGIAGVLHLVTRFAKRPVLLVFLALVLTLSFYLPNHVLFLSVEGNTTIPTRYILEIAAECGIRFGSARRQVRSEIIKNRLLEKIPQLQWAGINTNGCTAIISVQEKSLHDKLLQNKNAVASIIAARDGVIQSCTVLKGNPLCTVGQAVKAGQTLVSGYLDCGNLTKTTQANAEIKALTFRELELLSPAAIGKRGELTAKKVNYSLRIGKKLIKFYKDSGNLDTTCGKIYSEEYVRLPGGFQLPVAIIKETVEYYAYIQSPIFADWDSWLPEFARHHLKNLLISGEIISEESAVNTIEDGCYYYGRFACLEMIGQVKYEQTLPKDG